MFNQLNEQMEAEISRDGAEGAMPNTCWSHMAALTADDMGPHSPPVVPAKNVFAFQFWMGPDKRINFVFWCARNSFKSFL